MKAIFSATLFFMTASLVAAPELTVEPDSHSFGKYPANQEKKHSFTLRNSGDEILKIEKIRHTCGCSAAKIEKTELKPGETTQLEAAILPESIGGPFSKGIFIHSNAKMQRIKMITLSGESVPLVTVLPQNNIYLGTLQAGKEFKQEFLLNSTEAVKLATPENHGNFAPELELTEITDKQFKLTASWTPTEQENVKIRIIIKIESPAGWNPIELNLHGSIKNQ